MQQGDLILVPSGVNVGTEFRAEQVGEHVFLALSSDKFGLMCFLDRYGPQVPDGCRGFRIHKVPTDAEGKPKRVAIVRPTEIPDEVWFKAFPLEKALTPDEQALAVLDTLPVGTVARRFSTVAIEEILKHKGAARASTIAITEPLIAIATGFDLVTRGIQALSEKNPPLGLLALKVNGLHGEIIQKAQGGQA